MANWIEFEAIKCQMPLVTVLERYRIGELRPSGINQLRGRCPLHAGEGRDTFHVNTAQQVFHCFSCGAGGSVLDLVAALEHCDLRQAAQKLLDWRGAPATAARPREVTVTKKRESIPPLSFRLRGVDPRHPYLKSRGISETTAAEFGVGFYSGPGLMSGRLAIPIDDEGGRLVGYAGRSLDRSEPRYKFPVGFPKSKLLFNLHRGSASDGLAVIVVEGFFDCLKVHQAGFRSVVALMGCCLYERQRYLLAQRFREIVLMLDGDLAGRQAAAAIADRVSPDCSVRKVELADNTQPDQLSEQSLRQILALKGGPPLLNN